VTRLVAEHFGPRGVPKRAFASQAEAGEFRRSREGLRQKRVYRCGVCNLWHLGKPSTNARTHPQEQGR
jgi:hypothetical protein